MPGPSKQALEISPATARTRLEDDSVTLLDVREQNEWDAGHAPGATHLPLGELRPDAVPITRPVVAVCRGGSRSEQAVQWLVAAGYDAQNLAGGMSAWEQAGLPVTRDDGSPGRIA